MPHGSFQGAPLSGMPGFASERRRGEGGRRGGPGGLFSRAGAGRARLRWAGLGWVAAAGSGSGRGAPLVLGLKRTGLAGLDWAGLGWAGLGWVFWLTMADGESATCSARATRGSATAQGRPANGSPAA